MIFRSLFFMLLSCFLFRGSDSHAENPSAALVPKREQPTLEKKSLGEMRPVHKFGDIYLTGQPSEADISLLKKHGIKTIITLRKPNELPWNEAAAIKQQGMKYVQAPFQKPDELNAKVLDEVLKVLRDKKRGPKVLHCGAANRVGAIWYAHRVLDGKIAHEEALKEAKIVGLRTPAYLKQAQAYVEQVQSNRDKPAAKEPVRPAEPAQEIKQVEPSTASEAVHEDS